MTRLSKFWWDEEGQDLVEYSLLMMFIALAVVSLLSGVQANLANMWVSMSQKISTVPRSAS